MAGLAERLGAYVARPSSFTDAEKDALLRESWSKAVATAGIDGDWRAPFVALYEALAVEYGAKDGEHDDNCPAYDAPAAACACNFREMGRALDLGLPIYQQIHDPHDWFEDSGSASARNMRCRICDLTRVEARYFA